MKELAASESFYVAFKNRRSHVHCFRGCPVVELVAESDIDVERGSVKNHGRGCYADCPIVIPGVEGVADLVVLYGIVIYFDRDVIAAYIIQREIDGYRLA